MDINTKLIGYAIGGLIIVTMGFVDDMKNLRPLYKFLFQLIAGMVIYVFGISIAGIKIPFIYMGLSPKKSLKGSINILNTIAHTAVDNVDSPSIEKIYLSSLSS